MKFAFVARYRPVWPTRVMCRLLEVSASGFYEWLNRPQSARSLANARLLVRIRESFALSGQTYGSPRIWKDMAEAGECCGENRVARLMRVAHISAQPKPRRKPTDTGLRPEHSIAPNVLERNFAASGPNRKWAADFTYIWTGEGWLFVAVVIDLYSRRVVGWSMQPTMTAQLVLDALMMAFVDRKELPLSSVAVDLELVLAPNSEQDFSQRLQAGVSRGPGRAAPVTFAERRRDTSPARIPPRTIPWEVRVGAMTRASGMTQR